MVAAMLLPVTISAPEAFASLHRPGQKQFDEPTQRGFFVMRQLGIFMTNALKGKCLTGPAGTLLPH